MTPATVAGLAKLAGAELIAVTDHNSALNLPAAEAACRAYGLRLLPGIEVNTAEEMHLLCYFKTVERALEYGEALYEALPAFPYDPAVWGEQLVMDEEDRVVQRVERLLTGAARWDVYQAKAACEALGGVALPAHADRSSYSLFAVLGAWPPDLDFAAVELYRPERREELEQWGLPPGIEVLSSSDAHCMEKVAGRLRELPEGSVLEKLL